MRTRGFTLVELLIVVAIIGVLSTIGVPTFRRMIVKSRHAEAKVGLGALYKAEAAFNAEFDSYGNRLGKMGVDDLTGENRYLLGSYVTGCLKPIGEAPLIASAPGQKLMAEFPAYYDPLIASATIGVFAVGRLTLKDCSNLSGVNPTNFRLTASGVVKTGVDLDNPAGGMADVDVWVIDQDRVLSHASDPN